MRAPRTLQLVEFCSLGGYENMAADLHLFHLCEAGCDHGFLRFYTWNRPTLSLGFFESRDVIDRARAEMDGVGMVRRPTGGRVVLHGDDLTYAIVIPKAPGAGLTAAYRMISECLVGGLSLLGVSLEFRRGVAGKTQSRNKPCFISASRYEITCGGRKLVGSAQKLGANSILQHGSIPLGPGYLDVTQYMSCREAERARLRRDTGAATCCLHQILPSRPDARTVARALAGGFAKSFDVTDNAWRINALKPATDVIAESLKSGILGP
jgi:lipoate-protein ligase A